jgi:hypothetical protein
MITVPQAAERVGRDPETIRHPFRAAARPKVGTQRIVDEGDLDQVAAGTGSLPLPPAWQLTWIGEPAPDSVRILRRSRRGR